MNGTNSQIKRNSSACFNNFSFLIIFLGYCFPASGQSSPPLNVPELQGLVIPSPSSPPPVTELFMLAFFEKAKATFVFSS